MNWYVVKLEFISPLHIGDDEAGIGVENVQSIIHSDTIFGALVNAASLIHEDLVNDLIKGNFLISSAFPYDEHHYYFPRPFWPLPSHFEKYSNEVKKSEFLQEVDFGSWIRGKLNQGNIMEPVSRSRKAAQIATVDVRSRNALDRQSSNTVFYQCGGVVFREKCGLYFILEIDNDGMEKFQEILATLKKLGLGGERSSGYGQFDFEVVGPVDTQQGIWRDIKTNTGNFFCLLSLWYPKENEQIDVNAYQTTLRKGWIFSTASAKQMKRKTCRMFKEGSISTNQATGRIVDVTPDGFDAHKVYRWGKALSVKMSIVLDHLPLEEAEYAKEMEGNF